MTDKTLICYFNYILCHKDDEWLLTGSSKYDTSHRVGSAGGYPLFQVAFSRAVFLLSASRRHASSAQTSKVGGFLPVRFRNQKTKSGHSTFARINPKAAKPLQRKPTGTRKPP